MTGEKVSRGEPMVGESERKGSEDSLFKKFKLFVLSLEILSIKNLDSFSQKVDGLSLRPSGVLEELVCNILLKYFHLSLQLLATALIRLEI